MNYLPPPVIGGSGVFMRELCSRISKNKVIALTGMRDQDEGIDIDGNMTVYRKKYLWLPKSGFNNIRLIKYIVLFVFNVCRLNYKNNFSYVVCGEYFPAGIGALVLNFFNGIPYFIVFHGEEIYKVIGWRKKIISLLISHSKGIVVNSENTKRLVIDFGVNERIIVCKPCADHNRFKPACSPSSFKKELGLLDKKIILTVSRLIPRKGHKLVISALKKILKKHPNSIYVIIGQDLGYEQKIKEHIINCNMMDNVIMTGFVTDEELLKYYQVCDVFVMVSDTGPTQDDLEGFGITCLEANACEKPVICGNTGGMPEAVEEGITGFIIDPTNDEIFVKRLDELLSDPEKCCRMGKEGRKRVIKYFDYEKRSLELTSQMHEILKQSGNVGTK